MGAPTWGERRSTRRVGISGGKLAVMDGRYEGEDVRGGGGREGKGRKERNNTTFFPI